MTISVFDLFSVGIGPSSSHTVGPMRAAERFVRDVARVMPLVNVASVQADLYGSLAATGVGHGTMPAILLGLEGYSPEAIQASQKEERLEAIESEGRIVFGGVSRVTMCVNDIVLHLRETLSFHPNGMTLSAQGVDGSQFSQTYFSVGGGFVVTEEEGTGGAPPSNMPLDFGSGAELVDLAEKNGGAFSAVMLMNECSLRSEDEVRAGLLHIREVGS